MKTVSVHVRPAGDPAQHAGDAVIVLHDPALIGCEASYTLGRIAVGHPRRPEPSFTDRVTLAEATTIVPIPWSAVDDAFAFGLRDVRIELHSEVLVNDGTTSPPMAAGIENRPLSPRVGEIRDEAAKQAIFPPDRFQFIENLLALPLKTKLLFAALTLAWLLLVVWNVFGLAIGDPYALPKMANRGAANETVEPAGDEFVLPWLMLPVTLTLGAGLWWLLSRNAARSYLTLRVKDESLAIHPRLVLPIGELVEGTTREPIRDATLRVVALNYTPMQTKHDGRYKGLRPRGLRLTHTSWVFSSGIVLYEQTVPSIAAGTLLGAAFSGEVKFAPLFAALFPPIAIGSDYGVKTMWMVQLISPALRDYETFPLPIVAPASAYQPGEPLGFGEGRDA